MDVGGCVGCRSVGWVLNESGANESVKAYGGQ